MNRLNFPENIVRLRHDKNLTQEELADFMGVTKASVSKWEKGNSMPDIMLLPQLAAYFDVTVDELIGYEAQLSSEQIRRKYAELSNDFAACPFADVLEKIRALAHKYYACYPFLLQLSVLYLNHYMLAETEEIRESLLQEAEAWCDRILENCSDVGVCSDAVVLKATVQLQLGRATEAIEVLEPSADPSRLAGQNGALLVQAYQLSGNTERARSYAQVKQYLDLLNLIGDAIVTLSLNENDMAYCEETIHRITGVMELYHLETLHPNVAAQFYFQSAIVYAVNRKEAETLAALSHFEKCVGKLMKAEQVELHGDDYFNLLDAWIERLPLGNMAPRNKGFIQQNLQVALSHPAFESIKDKDDFLRIVHRLTEGGVRNA